MSYFIHHCSATCFRKKKKKKQKKAKKREENKQTKASRFPTSIKLEAEASTIANHHTQARIAPAPFRGSVPCLRPLPESAGAAPHSEATLTSRAVLHSCGHQRAIRRIPWKVLRDPQIPPHALQCCVSRFCNDYSTEKVQMLFTTEGEKPPKAQTAKLENTGCNPPVLQNLPFWKWENNTEIWATECV